MKGFGDLYKEKKKKTQKTKSSKEQIIKKAIQFHSEGNISEASKYYEYCLNQRFNDHEFFKLWSNLTKSGKTQQAEDSYRKAIELDPNFAFPYSNLGNILRDQEKPTSRRFAEKQLNLIQTLQLHIAIGNYL